MPNRLDLGNEEDRFMLTTTGDAVINSLFHPLVTANVLKQFGVVMADEGGNLPSNVFSYAVQLAKHGMGWTGVYTRALFMIADRYAARWATQYLDTHFPEMGGKAEHMGVDERELTDEQSFRRMLRAAIRDSTVRTVATLAARPFIVLCVRQIAQLIGGESKQVDPVEGWKLILSEAGLGGLFSALGGVVMKEGLGGLFSARNWRVAPLEWKYLDVEQGLRLILTEEGLGGLWRGVVPDLCSELVTVWGNHVISFVGQRALTRTGIDKGEDVVKGEKRYKTAQWLIRLVTSWIVSPYSNAYSAKSNVMACVGSGLLVSSLPCNPTFNNWQNCYGFKRGTKMFLREQIRNDVV